MTFSERIYQRLLALPERETECFPVHVLPEGHTTAAVLIPLWPTRTGGVETVFTRRAAGLPTHGGQVSFPGGRIHPEDPSLEMTALRETHEELGIPPDQVVIMGRLDDAWSFYGHHVIPYVGWLPARPEIQADPGEVAEIIIGDMEILLRPETATFHEHVFKGLSRRTHAFDWQGGYVWGLTADILQELLLWVSGKASNRGNLRLRLMQERLRQQQIVQQNKIPGAGQE